MALPQGTVTFLFTDIEGSTGLAERLGDAWPGVLAETRRLIREAAAGHGGVEIDCRGDELFFAFASAEEAARTAADIQRAFAGREWADGARVRVRAGLHTGTPQIEEDGYVGVDVQRAARVCSAAHGGQVVLTEATAELLSASGVRELGEHRLEGLSGAVRLLQLEVEGLADTFPALRGAKPGTPLRVALAEDSVLLREGVARLLDDAGFEVVAQAGTAEDLLRHVAMHKPDVAVVDIRMPPTQTDEGLRAAHEIRERFPDVGVLVLSQYVEPAYALELLGEGAEGVGYLLKDRVADVDEFAAAVRRVAEGGSALDPAVVGELVGRRRADGPIESLTPREREVLGLMAEGKSNQAIAESLFVTLRAVEKHVTSIFTKLGLSASEHDHRRVLAVLAFLRS